MRKLCTGNSSIPKKPIIGIAKVLGVTSETKRRLKFTFLSLSTPQYVDTPWSDSEIFVHGQQIIYKEDVRIILDEYKLSLRHHKAKPIFNDLFVSLSFFSSSKLIYMAYIENNFLKYDTAKYEQSSQVFIYTFWLTPFYGKKYR